MSETQHQPLIPDTFPAGKVICTVCAENWPCAARRKSIAAEVMPALEDDRTAMMLGLVPDKRTPEERLLHAILTNGESLSYHHSDPT